MSLKEVALTKNRDADVIFIEQLMKDLPFVEVYEKPLPNSGIKHLLIRIQGWAEDEERERMVRDLAMKARPKVLGFGFPREIPSELDGIPEEEIFQVSLRLINSP